MSDVTIQVENVSIKFPKTRVIAFDRDSTVAPIAENLKKKNI